MQLERAIELLRTHSAAIVALCSGVTAEEARSRADQASSSILEVLCHLYDEEREDFRQRLQLTLEQPESAWPLIDPQGWVSSREYQQRDLQQVLADFAAERQQSLAWLQALAAPDLNITRSHPGGFVLRAGDLLSAWVAHDLLHLRQLIELRYQLSKSLAAPYSLEYAGDW